MQSVLKEHEQFADPLRTFSNRQEAKKDILETLLSIKHQHMKKHALGKTDAARIVQRALHQNHSIKVTNVSEIDFSSAEAAVGNFHQGPVNIAEIYTASLGELCHLFLCTTFIP